MNFDQDSKFSKELKSLCKKHKSLAKDLGNFQLVHQSLYAPAVDKDFKRNFFNSNKAAILRESNDRRIGIVKARLDSRDLNSKALRVIYCYDLNKQKITLIELYAKNQKDNEDKKRWQEYAA